MLEFKNKKIMVSELINCVGVCVRFGGGGGGGELIMGSNQNIKLNKTY